MSKRTFRMWDDDGDGLPRVTRYNPMVEQMKTTAELKELQKLARELAKRLLESCVVQSYDGPVVCLQCNATNITTRAKLLPFSHNDGCIITRARKMGLLEAK